MPAVVVVLVQDHRVTNSGCFSDGNRTFLVTWAFIKFNLLQHWTTFVTTDNTKECCCSPNVISHLLVSSNPVPFPKHILTMPERLEWSVTPKFHSIINSCRRSLEQRLAYAEANSYIVFHVWNSEMQICATELFRLSCPLREQRPGQSKGIAYGAG